MKYEKTDSFDDLIAEVMSESADRETDDFLSADGFDAEISEELDRKVQALVEKKSVKELFRTRYYPRILSTAALVIFVAFFFSFVAMMSTFVKFPGDITVPQPTDSTDGDFGSSSSSDSDSDQSGFTSVSESTKKTEHPTSQTETTDPGRSESTCKQQGGTNPVYGETPSDEKKVFCIITNGNIDGVFLRVSIAGYQSNSLGKEFYVKSNEYFAVTVEITNNSPRTLYRIVGTDCSESAAPHSHDIALGLACNGRSLCSSSIGFDCGKAFTEEPLKPGETYTYQLKYAAGEEVASGFDLPGDGKDYPAGIKLYDQQFYFFYRNGWCEFQGYLMFDYCKEGVGIISFPLPLSLEVLYVK